VSQSPHRTEDLRRTTDEGGAGDKVRFPDPAAAPLGADDEAAGRPATPDRVALAAGHEVGAGSSENAPAANENPQTRRETWWIYLVVVALAVGLVAVFLGRG
jgi:hypothetical protein